MRIPECATLRREGGVINEAVLTGYPFRKRSKIGSQPAKEWREVTECEVLHAACVADTGLASPLQDYAGLWSGTHLGPIAISGP